MTTTGEAPQQVVTVRSVERSLDLLEMLSTASGEGLTLSQLAQQSELASPTILRLLRTLLARGYVRMSGPRRYALGARARSLASASNVSLSSLAQPYLQQMVDLSGETAKLGVLDATEVLCVASIASPNPIRMFSEPGARMLPHATSLGKALLARLPDEQVRALVTQTGLPRLTSTTVTDLAQLQEQLRQIRAQGYALDEGERDEEVRCVAVSVESAAGLLAFSISGPASRVSVATREALVPGMHEIADRLAEALSPPRGGR